MVVQIMVDAIEEGKIVRVTQEYASREGLMVLRKIEEHPASPFLPSPQKPKKNEPVFEPFRKPLKKNNASDSLRDHFHWEIMERRKERNITRKQLAQSVGETEYNIKMLENGMLPSDDFVLISKIEKYFGINLRKNPNESAAPIQRQRYDQRMREKLMKEEIKDSVSPHEKITGSDIEID